MKAENFIELIEQRRFDKISENGMTLIAERFRELQTEKLTIPFVSGSVITVNEQVEIIKEVIDEMMTTFNDEKDRIDYILDFVNGYKKRLSKHYH